MEIVKEDMTTPGLTVTKMTDEATGENLELDMEMLREEDMTTPRPTAGNPRDKFGEFWGHDKVRRRVVPLGREQTKNVCKELTKDTERVSNEESKRNICSTDPSERNEPEQNKKRRKSFTEEEREGEICGVSDYVFTSDVCKKQFPDGNGLNQHLIKTTKKFSNEEFKCNICSTGFSERNELEEHKMTNHVCFSICAACKKQFPDGNGLDQHLRQYHQDQDPMVSFKNTNITDNTVNLWLRQQEQEREERERVRREEIEKEEKIRREDREERIREAREEREDRIRREETEERERREEREEAERNRSEEREDRKRREEREGRRAIKFPKFSKDEDLDTFRQIVNLWNMDSKSTPSEKMLDFWQLWRGDQRRKERSSKQNV